MTLELTKEYFEDLDSKLTLIPLSYDRAFKCVFKLNLDLLRKFLNEILPIKITDENKITLLDGELPISNKKERQKIVDIFVVINENIFIDIEINRSKFKDVYERNKQYLDKVSNLLFEKGEDIKDLKNRKIYQININAHHNEDITDDIIVSYGLITKQVYPSLGQMIVKGLERYRQKYYNGDVTKSVIWLTILTARTFTEMYDLVSKVLDKNEVQRLMEAVVDMCRDGFILHEWQKDKMDALVKYNEIENATNEGKALGIAEGKTLGIAEGKTLGIAEGIKQNKFEIAKNMLKKNMSLEDISEITGLTIYDIKKIKNKEV